MGYILKGIGDALTGANEIVPTFDAKIFNFYAQMLPGVVTSEQNRFPITVVDRGILIGPGMAHAFGYFGLCDAPVTFNYIIPSSQKQYAKVYVEFDLSQRPQSFSIQTTQQSDSPDIELQQDNLSEMTTGIYQVPLYLISIQTNGTITYQDIRPLMDRISYANHSNESNHSLEANHSINSDNAIKADRIVFTSTLPTSSPPSGTCIIYYGTSVPSTRYDRVIYFITV